MSALWRKEQRASTNSKWSGTRWEFPNTCFIFVSQVCEMRRGNTWPSCWQSQRRLRMNKTEAARWFAPLRNSSRRACPSLQLFGERSRFANTLSSASSTYSRSGREGDVSDMTSSEVSMSGTAGDWGVEPMLETEKHMPRNQPWNATWHRLGWACREPQ